MKYGLMKLAIVCAVSLFAVAPQAAAAMDEPAHAHKQCVSQPEVQLRAELRKLWIDHTIWTRNYIISALAGLDDQEQALARLMKNQQDIGDAIKPYYGEAAGNKLAELLKEHISIAGQVVGAVKSGNAEDLKRYNKAWYRNADQIAQFLSSANPNWTEKQLKQLLYTHLQLLTDQVVARVNKDWDADIAAFDKGEEHIIMLADVLADGLVKQFPNQF